MKLAVVFMMSLLMTTCTNAEVYDINHLFAPNATGSITPATLGRGQTFQMGKSGSLDQIIVTAGFYNSFATTATLKLYELTGNELNGAALASPIATSTAVIPADNTQANHTFNFQNLNFPAGKKLAFAMFGHISLSIGLGGAPPANSTPIVVDNGNIFYTARTASFATVITPVPEPSTLSLAAISLITLARRRRA